MHMSSRNKTLVAAVLVGLVAASVGWAVDLTNSDSFGNTSFNSSGNWSPAGAPSGGNDYFTGNFLLRTPHNQAADYTFAGDSLTIDGGTLGYKGSGNRTITINDLRLDGGTVANIANGSSSFNLAGNVEILAGGGTFATNVGPTRYMRVYSPISGSGAVQVNGNGGGATYLHGSNTYAGQTTVSGGYLVTANSQALGSNSSGTVVQNGATLQFETGTNTIAGEAVTLNGQGVGGTRGAMANWSGNNTWTGPVTLGSNSRIFTNSGSLELSGVIDGTGELLRTGNAGSTLILSGSGANTYVGTTALAGGYTAFSKDAGVTAVPGNLAFTNNGSPTAWTTNDNQFSAGTVISFAGGSGNARLNLIGTNQQAAGITDASGRGVIQNSESAFGGPSNSGTSNLTLAPANGDSYSFNGYLRDWTGTVELTKNGLGTQTLTGPRITYTGDTTVNAGTLVLQGSAFSTTPRDYVIANGTILNIDGNTGVASGTTSISGQGELRITNGNFGNEGPNSPAGPGRNINLSLGDDGLIDVQTGAFMRNGGWQNVNWAGNTAPLNVDGTFDLWDGQTVRVGAVSGNGTIQKGHGGGGTKDFIVGLDGSDGTFSGSANFVNGGSSYRLVKEGLGTQTLVGNNITYASPTIINAGTLELRLQNSGSSSTFNSAITVNPSGTLELFSTDAGVDNWVIDTPISGTGNIVKNGPGWVKIRTPGGLGGFHGNLTINEGTFGNGFNAVGDWTGSTATVTVNSPGVLDLRTDNVTIGALNGNGTVANTYGTLDPVNTLTVGAGNGSGDFSGIIRGAGGGTNNSSFDAGVISLVKTGRGTQTLTGANTYTGPTTVNGGVLAIGDGIGTNGSIPSGETVTINAPGTLQWNNNNSGSPKSIPHSHAGDGTLRFQGQNSAAAIQTSEYRVSGDNSGFTGTIELNRAILWDNTLQSQLGSADVDIQDRGTLALNGGTWSNNVTLQSGSGWHHNVSGNVVLGALRLQGTNVLNGDLVLNNAASPVAIGDNSGANSAIGGWGGGNHTINGTISGDGHLSMSRHTAGSGGAVNIRLAGATDNTFTGTTVVDGQGAISSLYLQKTGGAVAIPGGTTVQFGSGTSGQANLRMGGDEQFGTNAGGVVLNWVNNVGQWGRFDLRGTTQTVAGLNSGTLTTQANGVIQNREFDNGTPNSYGAATLTLAGGGDYTYFGYLRDVDGGGVGSDLLHLAKTGSGTQALVGNRITYTGDTTVSGGALNLHNTPNFNSSITNNAEVGIHATSGDAWRLIGGNTLSGNGTWIKTGAGRATFDNTTLTTSGQFLIQEGTLRNNFNSSNWSGSTADVDVSAGAILDLYADPIQVDELTGAGFVQNNFGNVSGFSGSAPFIERFSVGVADGSSTFDGVIRDNSNGTAPAGGTAGGGIDLVKTGSGTLTLTGANTYTGTTTISGGSLLVDGSHVGGGVYTIAAGASLGGTGSITAAVINNGVIAPGSSPGSLTLGDLPGGIGLYEWELFDANVALGPGVVDTSWDLLTVGILTVNAGVDTILVQGLDGLPADLGIPANLDLTDKGDVTGPFEVLRVGGVTGGNLDDLLGIGINPGNLGQYGYFTSSRSGNSLYLTFTSTVPEPGTVWLAIAMGATLIAVGRRRSGKSS